MHSRHPAADPPTISEAPGTVGLLLNVAAVVSFAVSLAAFAVGESALAGSIAVAAVVGFAASLICFAVDRPRPDEHAVRE
jgi:hypothetical protein